MTSEMLTIAQAARWLRVNVRTLQKWVRAGRVKVDENRMIWFPDLLALLDLEEATTWTPFRTQYPVQPPPRRGPRPTIDLVDTEEL